MNPAPSQPAWAGFFVSLFALKTGKHRSYEITERSLTGTAFAWPKLHQISPSKVHGPTHVHTRQTCVGPPPGFAASLIAKPARVNRRAQLDGQRLTKPFS